MNPLLLEYRCCGEAREEIMRLRSDRQKLVKALENAYDALVTYGYAQEDRAIDSLALLRELGEAR